MSGATRPANEQDPLLLRSQADARAKVQKADARVVSEPSVGLGSAARTLISQLRRSAEGGVDVAFPNTSLRGDFDRDIAVRAFALYILSDQVSERHRTSDVEGADEDALVAGLSDPERAEVEERVSDSLKGLLDQQLRGAASAASNALLGLWTPWPTGRSQRECTCAIELLLPPFAPTAHPLLAHPALAKTVEDAWQNGIDNTHESPLSDERNLVRRLHRTLRQSMTPSRLHILHLISLLFLYIIVIILSIRPGNYATPDSPFGGDGKRVRGKWIPSPAEGAATVWVVSGFWSAFHRPPSSARLLLLPLYLAVPVSLWHNSYAFNLLTISIPCLTTLLVLPSYPSLALLSPRSLLPLAVLLADTLYRLIIPMLILSPLALGLTFATSWAVNGDLGQFTVSAANLVWEPAVNRSRKWSDWEGTAPVQTRWLLAFSLCLVLVYGIVLGIARVTLRLTRSPFEYRGGQPVSTYPARIQIEAQAELAKAVLAGLGKPHIATSKLAADSEDQIAAPGTYGSIEEGRRNADHQISTNGTTSLTPGSASGVESSSHVQRKLDPFVVCPIPLNQLFDLLEVAHGIIWLMRKTHTLLPAMWAETVKERGEIWEEKIGDVGEGCAVWLVGPVCWLMEIAGRLIGGSG